MRSGPKPVDPYIRVMRKTKEEENDCLLWTGVINSAGYGVVGGRRKDNPSKYQMLYVHKVVWEHYNGIVPFEDECSHLCGNRLCVNIKHIITETRFENIQRKREHGNGRAKDITKEELKKVLDMKCIGFTHEDIADTLGLSIWVVTDNIRKYYL